MNSKAERWRTEFLNKMWLDVNEDVPYKKILGSKHKTDVRNLGSRKVKS